MPQTTEENHFTFQDHFFKDCAPTKIKVPDYQRAFSWKEKQISLFINDLKQYSETKNPYYFGHFISEDNGNSLEIVDGQQRITTLVLFLITCRHLRSLENKNNSSDNVLKLIDNFTTVNYDDKALKNITSHLGPLIQRTKDRTNNEVLSRELIIEVCELKASEFTNSQLRIAQALVQFSQAFEKGKLLTSTIDTYIDCIMHSNCSHHATRDKSVAVNIFEMHNTRGMPLSTMEIVKAKLMKYVYDKSHNEDDKNKNVTQIQSDFGKIYQLESLLSESSFHGKMTLEQLLHYHLRAVDDGNKTTTTEFHSPANNASSEDLIKYIDEQLAQKNKGTEYALQVITEFLSSVQIMSQIIPEWDNKNNLVGDVLILDHGLSCQFFLLYCRMEDYDYLTQDILELWEKLVYTCDFHGLYHGLRYRDNFELFFCEFKADPKKLKNLLGEYLKNGFRSGITTNLQDQVIKHFIENETNILNGAYHWWKQKIRYSLYKYEKDLKADLVKLREIMEGSTSVEHILPQEWTNLFTANHHPESENIKKGIHESINGLGNLLLITNSKNSSVSNDSPSIKDYTDSCTGGSYSQHKDNKELWKDSTKWTQLIEERGKNIYKFILNKQLGFEFTEKN